MVLDLKGKVTRDEAHRTTGVSTGMVSKIWADGPQAAPQAPPSPLPDAAPPDALELLARQVTVLEGFAEQARVAGNVKDFSQIVRHTNATLALAAKLAPPDPPDANDNPDVQAAAKLAVARVHELIDRALNDGS